MTTQTPIDIEKNKREFYRISETTYKGKDLVDLRVFFRSPDKPEGFPTRKGISIPVERLKPVFEALESLIKQKKYSSDGLNTQPTQAQTEPVH